MRMITDDAVIERSGVSNETEFGIQFNAKMARILSKQIYSNVIQAPIREIICNAWDSHRAAGKLSTPIRVHLPNQMEPWFEVQDEGLGMDVVMMQVQYTTYGASTKSDSNDDIGGLGLGCKAPFAYTDAFTVTSVHDHVRRSYSLFKNERGIPALALMGEEACDAPNGVTVRVPVKKVDFDRFRTETQQVLRWFDTPFDVTGNSDYKPWLPSKLDVVKGDRWYLMESTYYNRMPSVAVMANVAYPIQAERLDRRFRELLGRNMCVVVEFDNGELEFAPSREELNYDDITIRVLEARLDQVLREARARVDKEFTNCTTLWEARARMRRLAYGGALSTMISILSQSGFVPQFKGEVVTGDTIYLNNAPGFSKELMLPSFALVSETLRAKPVIYVDPNVKAVFVRGDVSDASARCRKAYYHKGAPAYLITGSNQQVDLVLRHLGNPPMILASTLDKADRKVMEFKGNAWRGTHSYYGRKYKSDRWDDTKTLSTAQGQYYVTQLNLDPVNDLDEEIPLSQMVSAAQELGLISTTTRIYGLNKTNSRLVADNHKWVRFDVYFREQVVKRLADPQLMDQVQLQNSLAQIRESVVCSDACAQLNRWFGNHTNVLGKLARDWITAEKQCKTLNNVATLRMAAHIVGMKIPEPQDNTNSLMALHKQVIQQYPLIRMLMNNRYPEEALYKDMVHYVNLVDQVAKSTVDTVDTGMAP